MDCISSYPTVQPKPTPRVPVVIIVEPDGYLTAYTSPGVDLRFVEVLPTNTPESRTLAEHYARCKLPALHREIAFDARCSKASMMPRPITPEAELNKQLDLRLLRDIEVARKEFDPRPVAIRLAHRHAVETRSKTKRVSA
jgi:hypothetical protein